MGPTERASRREAGRRDPARRRAPARRALAFSLAASALLAASPARALDGAGLLSHELGLAVGELSGFTASLSYTPSFRLLDGRLRLGLGARFTAWLGRDGVEYRTADADLIRAGAVHSLTVDDPRLYALNLFFAVSVRIWAGLEAGMNIDLLGAGFGPSTTGAYAGASPSFSGPQPARPSSFDLLRLGDRDKGQLDSEFFLAYWLGSWGVRAGWSHTVTEYTTNLPLDGGNDRFRVAQTRLLLGAGWRFD